MSLGDSSVGLARADSTESSSVRLFAGIDMGPQCASNSGAHRANICWDACITTGVSGCRRLRAATTLRDDSRSESKRRHHHVGALDQFASPASHERARAWVEASRPPAARRLVSVVVQKAPVRVRPGHVGFLNQDSWSGVFAFRTPTQMLPSTGVVRAQEIAATSHRHLPSRGPRSRSRTSVILRCVAR